MSNVAESVNSLIVQTSGGILAIWGGALFFFVKFLKWCGEKIAEGANNDLIAKMMPTIEDHLDEKLLKFEGVLEDVNDIKNSLHNYREKKHEIEGENESLKQLIINSDQEGLKELKNFLIRRELKNAEEK